MAGGRISREPGASLEAAMIVDRKARISEPNDPQSLPAAQRAPVVPGLARSPIPLGGGRCRTIRENRTMEGGA